jgi:hypothetical protein
MKKKISLYGFLGLAALAAVLLFTASVTATPVVAEDPSPPIIDVWYGGHQVFGQSGLPQKWINILGNATDPESGIEYVQYRLNNGEAVRLLVGPDRRRLARLGDFNIELEAAGLKPGENQVEIEAVNGTGQPSSSRVVVEWEEQETRLPFTIDWARVQNAQTVLQIVDGKWNWSADGIRPAEVAYDRVLAVGDMRWKDYEVTVPITVHGVDKSGYLTKESGGAGFGINMRWMGHTDDPYHCDWPSKPHCGWIPYGASNWFSFRRSGDKTLAIESESPKGADTLKDQKLEFEHAYVYKTRVESQPVGDRYLLKVWEPARESEPTEWTLVRNTAPGEGEAPYLPNGAFLLVAHHVDLTFGNITVTAVR